MYAIQIFFGGDWLYVMTARGNDVQTFPTKEEAEEAAASWQKSNHKNKVRVVEYK
jgi:hypothetical protein